MAFVQVTQKGVGAIHVNTNGIEVVRTSGGGGTNLLMASEREVEVTESPSEVMNRIRQGS